MPSGKCIRRQGLQTPYIFDAQHYESLNSARAAVLATVLVPLKNQVGLSSAIDVGCGLGHFSGLLHSLGFQVTAVDGRRDNVTEAQRRYPHIRFHHCDVQDPALVQLGRFDLVFCFGILYHLESPFLAVKNLHEMTARLLLVESVIFPGRAPIMALIDEPPGEDQGLHHFAFYPTEACLEKMLYRAGFSYAYRFSGFPDHPGYHDAPGWRRVRTMLAGSSHHLQTPHLTLVPEPASPIRPWDGTSGVSGPDSVNRLLRFARKPMLQKIETIKRLMKVS